MNGVFPGGVNTGRNAGKETIDKQGKYGVFMPGRNRAEGELMKSPIFQSFHEV